MFYLVSTSLTKICAYFFFIQVQSQRATTSAGGPALGEPSREPSRGRAHPREQQPAEPAGPRVRQSARAAADAAQQSTRARLVGLARGPARLAARALPRRAGAQVATGRQFGEPSGAGGCHAAEQAH